MEVKMEEKKEYIDTTIGAFQFRNSYMIEIIIDQNIHSLMEYAFQNCYNLRTILLPNSIQHIKTGCFSNCRSLKYFNIPPISIIEKETFEGCESLEHVCIPDTIVKICDRAFRFCRSLNFIKLPPKLLFIGEECFAYCIQLYDIHISSIHRIGNCAFLNSGLKELILPKLDITIWIRYGAFSECRSLVKVEIYNALLQNNVFQNCVSLKSIKCCNLEHSDSFRNCNNIELIQYKYMTIMRVKSDEDCMKSLGECIETFSIHDKKQMFKILKETYHLIDTNISLTSLFAIQKYIYTHKRNFQSAYLIIDSCLKN